mgnify:FL=1
MEKIVRVYYTSFIDVPCMSENFSNEEEMVEWAKDNSGDFFSYQEVSDNLSKDAEVVDL